MTATSPTTSPRPFHELDISAEEFWGLDFRTRDETFAKLRAADGLSWHRPVQSIFPHAETGYWAVTRHADIRYVSQHNELFTSTMGVSLDPMPAEIQRSITFFLTMDPPEHTRYRRLISMAFTPKQIRAIEDQMRISATEIVDELVADLATGKELDFAADVANKMPMRTISDMIGISPEDRAKIAYAAESLFSGSDDDYAALEERATHLMAQLNILTTAGVELAARRRTDPRDDLMTNIVNAEVDGHRLTDAEVGAFLVLLGGAGNDTTKQTTSHAFKALVDHPAQRAWLLDDFDERIDDAIDEFIRWATPVVTFARHATVDTEVAGSRIKAGEKLVLFYSSANRDESVFDRPHEFDITRSPNQHIAFGGGGAHHCLGKQLARMELRHLFRELLTRLPEVELGTPEYVHSNFIHGIKRMPITRR